MVSVLPWAPRMTTLASRLLGIAMESYEEMIRETLRSYYYSDGQRQAETNNSSRRKQTQRVSGLGLRIRTQERIRLQEKRHRQQQAAAEYRPALI